MKNIFKELPWSVIRVLKYIVKCHKSGKKVNAITIRSKFNFGRLEEQPYLELLCQYGYIDHIGHFYEDKKIFTFRPTAKAITSFEAFTELTVLYFVSSVAVPAVVSLIVSILTNWVIHG